ncbi:MAG: peptidase T [Synergistaceae bacterium]|jgi:tripeptide aminopeptidase|nr:peptidase T [Synergistaceae bacterium]
MPGPTVLDRFLKYVTYDTQSAHDAKETPSTKGQLVFARALAEELREVGLSDVSHNDHAYVTATLPSNLKGKSAPTVALIAHLDTSVEVSGANVKPRILRYEGGDIVLNAEKNIVTSPDIITELNLWMGTDIVVTDGNTLLGADDKSGIAAIVGAADWYARNPGVPHGTVKLVFTPDEEVGHLAALLDLDKLGADFAYTVDGSELGTLSWETFNAARALITVKGISAHPGKAKGKMKSAILMLNEFLSMLPPNETPSTSEGREGYYHLFSAEGDVEDATATVTVRDFDMAKFNERKGLISGLVDKMNAKYGNSVFKADIKDSYYNMGEKLKDKMQIVEYARRAMKEAGVTPNEYAARGGTDGSALTWRGLPTPNIFTGGYISHSRHEFLSTVALEKSCDTIKALIRIIAES